MSNAIAVIVIGWASKGVAEGLPSQVGLHVVNLRTRQVLAVHVILC